MKKTTDRKRVNFSNFSDKNRTLLHDFRTAIIAIAEENAKYSTASKPSRLSVKRLLRSESLPFKMEWITMML